MNKFKKILSAMLAVIMLLGCFVFSVGADSAEIPTGADVWDGTADASWYEKAKAEQTNVLSIKTAEQLAGFSKLVNDEEESFEGWKVTLETDVIWNDGNAADFATTAPANVWTPIAGFKGEFDGKGHVISGLYFNGISNGTSVSNVGLFATLNGATVKNVSVVNSYFAGKQNVATFVGLIEISASTVSNCYSDAIIDVDPGTTEGVFSGGIVGHIKCGGSLIEKCWFAGKITAEYKAQASSNNGQKCGGIVGYTENYASGATGHSTIINCLMTGSVTAQNQVGGILGVARDFDEQGTVLENCLMLGSVRVTRRDSQTLFFGQFACVWQTTGRITLTNVYGLNTYKAIVDSTLFTDKEDLKATKVCNVKDAGKIVADTSATVAAESLTGDTAKDTLASFDFDGEDAIWATVAEGTPVIKNLRTSVNAEADTYSGTADTDNYGSFEVTLNTPEEFAALSTRAASGETFANWTINLGADLYFNTGLADTFGEAQNRWTPISEFAGTLNGNGHSLNGLYCNLKTNNGAALISTLSGEVTDLSVINSYFYGNKNVSAVAGVAGADSRISKIYTDAYLYSVVQQEGAYSGGIVGQTSGNGCEISECQFAGKIEVSGDTTDHAQKVGGILGYTANTVTVKDCLVTGTVVATYQVGGIVGIAYNGSNVTLTNCVFLGKVVATRNNATTYLGSVIGCVWKKNLTVTMNNCYHEENYSAIYDAPNPKKDYATAYYSQASGSDATAIINNNCSTISLYDAEATVTALGSAWKYSENEFPMLKTVVDRFADANIFAAEVQTNEEENSFRLVAGIKGIELEDYASVSYRIEVITKDGTLRDNEQSTRVYSGLTVDETPKTAQDYSSDYLYIRKVTGFDSEEKVTVICTPMLTHKDGRVIYGTPDAFAFAFAD